MNYQKILESLCTYDLRNPEGIISFYLDQEDLDDEIKYPDRVDCACDNCFYGRTQLAIELLKYVKNDKNN